MLNYRLDICFGVSVMLNTAGEAGKAGEAADVFSRPSYDSPSAGGDTTRSGLRLRPITGHR